MQMYQKMLMTIYKIYQEMTKIDYMCQEKKTEEENSPASQISLMYQYEVSKTTLKRTKRSNYRGQWQR